MANIYSKNAFKYSLLGTIYYFKRPDLGGNLYMNMSKELETIKVMNKDDSHLPYH